MKNKHFPTNEEICEAAGISLDCESPLELSTEDGCRATGRFARYVLVGLKEDWPHANYSPEDLKDFI